MRKRNNARPKASMWHDSYVLLVLVLAAVAVLYCVVMVSQGRGGELAEFAPDVPPLNLPEPGQLTAADFMVLHLPVSLVGYHTQSVDETLQRAATAIGERDTHIAVLEQRVAELLAGRLQARQAGYTRPSWAPPVSQPVAEPEWEWDTAPDPVAESEPATGANDPTADAPAKDPMADAPVKEPAADDSAKERGSFEPPARADDSFGSSEDETRGAANGGGLATTDRSESKDAR